MKKIGIILLLIALVVVGLIFARNIVVKTVLTAGVKAITGLELKVRNIHIGIVDTAVGVNDLLLLNPKDFSDRIMVDLPEVYVDYDIGAFLKKNIHLEEVRLNLKEFMVVKNESGQLNLDALKAVQS